MIIIAFEDIDRWHMKTRIRHESRGDKARALTLHSYKFLCDKNSPLPSV